MARLEQDLTDAHWAALVEEWGGCACCGSTRTASRQKDCMLPISRRSRHTVANVVPACRWWNASKCSAELTTWMRREHLDESAFLTHQWHIAHELGSLAGRGTRHRAGELRPKWLVATTAGREEATIPGRTA